LYNVLQAASTCLFILAVLLTKGIFVHATLFNYSYQDIKEAHYILFQLTLKGQLAVALSRFR